MNSRSTQYASTSELSTWDWSCDEEDAGSESSVEVLPRTQRLILEYKQFKAAQLIQRYVRGWLVRLQMRTLLLAAVVIQKWWRRYMAQRILIVLAESKLQLAVVKHHHASATLIQKTFRGWWTRRHVNDLTKLKSMQESLARSILHILGVYLHQLKRNGQLPGVHSEHLPKECLESINHLMSTLDYRIFNAFSCYRMQRIMAEINDLRIAFKKSTYQTYGPFNGFDCGYVGLTTEKVDEDQPENAHLIRSFVCQKHDMDLTTKFAHKVPTEDADKSKQLELDAKVRGFLKRIILDMKKWNDADGIEMPKNMSNVSDIKALLEEVKKNLDETCNCGELYADM